MKENFIEDCRNVWSKRLDEFEKNNATLEVLIVERLLQWVEISLPLRLVTIEITDTCAQMGYNLKDMIRSLGFDPKQLPGTMLNNAIARVAMTLETQGFVCKVYVSSGPIVYFDFETKAFERTT